MYLVAVGFVEHHADRYTRSLVVKTNATTKAKVPKTRRLRVVFERDLVIAETH